MTVYYSRDNLFTVKKDPNGLIGIPVNTVGVTGKGLAKYMELHGRC